MVVVVSLSFGENAAGSSTYQLDATLPSLTTQAKTPTMSVTFLLDYSQLMLKINMISHNQVTLKERSISGSFSGAHSDLETVFSLFPVIQVLMIIKACRCINIMLLFFLFASV